jgi:hypothetical protein
MSDQGDHRTRQQLLRDAISTFARELISRDATFADVGFTLIVHSRDLTVHGYEMVTTLPERDLMRALLSDLVADELLGEAHAAGVAPDGIDKWCGDMALRDVQALERRRGERRGD